MSSPRCQCGRPAVFRSPGGKYRADAHHDLCPRCWRANLNRTRAQKRGHR